MDSWKRAEPEVRDKWGRQTDEVRDSEVNYLGWCRGGMRERCEACALREWEAEGVLLPSLSLYDSTCWLQRSSVTEDANKSSLQNWPAPGRPTGVLHSRTVSIVFVRGLSSQICGGDNTLGGRSAFSHRRCLWWLSCCSRSLLRKQKLQAVALIAWRVTLCHLGNNLSFCSRGMFATPFKTENI